MLIKPIRTSIMKYKKGGDYEKGKGGNYRKLVVTS
jgi:hypothetical protein